MRILGVLSTVIFTLMTSVLLNIASDKSHYIAFSIIALVIFINAVKFFLWGLLNKKYDLSKTYPLTTLFYPLIFLYSVIFDNGHVTLQKVVGISVIIIGVLMFEMRGRKV
jgi:multidrug transporter EmrE-like cation transporter